MPSSEECKVSPEPSEVDEDEVPVDEELESSFCPVFSEDGKGSVG